MTTSISHWGMFNQEVDNAIGGFMGDASIRKDEDCAHRQQVSTSPTQTSETRETFESWYDNRHGTDLAKCRLGNFYKGYPVADEAWAAWQACAECTHEATPQESHQAATYDEITELALVIRKADEGPDYYGCMARAAYDHMTAKFSASYDERESRNAFEAWAGKYCHLSQTQNGTYTSDRTQAKWEGWRKREAKRGLDSSAIDYSIKLQQILESVFRQRRETPHKHLYHGREIALFKANFNRTLFALKFGDGN